MLAGLLSWLCFPVYLVLGIWTRQRSLRLSPAAGPRSGVYGEGAPVHRLLSVGDSSAAGVGLERTEDALVAQAARLLHEDTGETVSWHISGHNSAVAEEVRDAVLPHLEPADYTHILVMVGVNDAKNWHTARRFKKGFGTLLYALRARFPEARLYWFRGIDARMVPALPEPLGWIMNLRIALMNRKGTQLCIERGVTALPAVPIEGPEGFCRDGFHAGADGYAVWARHLLDHLHHTPRDTPVAAPYV